MGNRLTLGRVQALKEVWRCTAERQLFLVGCCHDLQCSNLGKLLTDLDDFGARRVSSQDRYARWRNAEVVGKRVNHCPVRSPPLWRSKYGYSVRAVGQFFNGRMFGVGTDADSKFHTTSLP